MAKLLRWAIIAFFLHISAGYAAQIAVDLEEGTVLVEAEADALRYPASLTKLMTAYVAFGALADGDINDATMVTISAFAAATPPVKLGVRSGARISFGDLLGAAVVGSKNDAAVAVAEAVAKTEESFTARMNAAAVRLGMTRTRFANATGLPAAGQRTTARDIAILSRALLQDFPRRSRLMSQRSVLVNGQRISTTNPLFGRVKGTEGLKTGFTCAAGYAIAALVMRDGRSVVAVSLGHTSKADRLRNIRQLIKASFMVGNVSGNSDRRSERFLNQHTRAAALLADKNPVDVGACDAAPQRLIATDISPEERALYAVELAKMKAALHARRFVSPSTPLGATSLQQPRRVQQGANRSVVSAQPPLSGWAIYLGAFPKREQARNRLRRLRLKGAGTLLIERRARDGLYRAVMYGLTQRQASTLCRVEKRYCIVLTPPTLLNQRAQWRR